MTWTKLSDDFGDQCADLSDAAFRTHVEGLLWAMRRENGGVLTARDVRRFGESQDAQTAVSELVARGFWDATGDNGYLVRHGMGVQIEPDVIAARRRADAERQARKRHKAAGLTATEDGASPSKSLSESRRDTPTDDPRDPGLVWTGRETPNPPRREEEEGSPFVRTSCGKRGICGTKCLRPQVRPVWRHTHPHKPARSAALHQLRTAPIPTRRLRLQAFLSRRGVSA
jgi:hypothetical protein